MNPQLISEKILLDLFKTAVSKKVLTLSMIVAPDEKNILLGMKKRGFGAGRWNGFGGKVEAGETIEEAAKREISEETGLACESLEERGVLRFFFDDTKAELEVHVFIVEGFSGTPKETEEMKPQWFSFRDIPYDTMWTDDRLWLPFFLKGKRVEGLFRFADDKTLVSYFLKN